MELRGKNAVILGVADGSSLSWAIAKRLSEHGARVWIGYQQKFFSRVRLLLQEHPDIEGARCDITKDEELEAFFERFRELPIDVLVHGIAFGPPEVFTDPPSSIRTDSFAQTLTISTHSLLKTAGYAKEHLREWGSIITLSYQASEQASPFYGMMGVAKSALESCVRYLAIEMGERKVRVNAVSPGPIETPAALGEMLAFLRNPGSHDTAAGAVLRPVLEHILNDPSFSGADEQVKARALWHAVQSRVAAECSIQEFVTQDDVADCALFLASDHARKITGQVIHVDCGMSSARLMPWPRMSEVASAPDKALSSPGEAATGGGMAREQPTLATPAAARTAGVEDGTGRRQDSGAGDEAVEENAVAVVQFLQRAFPECITGELRTPGVARSAGGYFCVDGDGVRASFAVSPELLGRPQADLLAALERCAVADVLRASGRALVVATSDGLRFAVSRPDDLVDEWCPQALASPEYVAEQPLELTFPDATRCSDFVRWLRQFVPGEVQLDQTADTRLRVRAPRRHVLGLLHAAREDYQAHAPAPGTPRLEWND